MFAKSLDELKLDENGKIGYTYKCMGAGFWALRQDNFRAALEAIAYEVIKDQFYNPRFKRNSSAVTAIRQTDAGVPA